MQDFKKLRVWHLANEVALDVIESLPASKSRKVPGLRSQAIRAATSVEDNIVEGCGKSTRAEFLQFVETSVASLNELEAQLNRARNTGIIRESGHLFFQQRINLMRRMLLSLMKTLQRRIAEDVAADMKRRRRAPNA